jgi:hypothetical protein
VRMSYRAPASRLARSRTPASCHAPAPSPPACSCHSCGARPGPVATRQQCRIRPFGSSASHRCPAAAMVLPCTRSHLGRRPYRSPRGHVPLPSDLLRRAGDQARSTRPWSGLHGHQPGCGSRRSRRQPDRPALALSPGHRWRRVTGGAGTRWRSARRCRRRCPRPRPVPRRPGRRGSR